MEGANGNAAVAPPTYVVRVCWKVFIARGYIEIEMMSRSHMAHITCRHQLSQCVYRKPSSFAVSTVDNVRVSPKILPGLPEGELLACGYRVRV
jgi:hypothetical protein